MSRLTLKKNEDRRLKLGHQWIFSNELENIEGEIKNGEVINVLVR